MARMSNHEIVESRRSMIDRDHVFHVTKKGWVLRTTGPRGGGAKLLFVAERNGKLLFNFSGMGRRATVAEFRERLNSMEEVPRG